VTADTEPAYSSFAAEPVELWEETVGQMLDRVAERYPDRDALVFAAPATAGRHWTYRQFVDETNRVARALLRFFSPGQNVAVWAPNCAEWVLLQHGAARAGIVLVTINPAYLDRELTYVLSQSQAAGLFYAPRYRGRDLAATVDAVSSALPGLWHRFSLDEWDQFVDHADPATPLPEPAPGDAAMIQYTSGTTGNPKGVLLSHRGIVNSARLVAERAEFGEAAVSVNSMPLYHIGGCGTMELGTFSRGGTYVLAPGFDPAHVLDLIENYRGTVALAVPTMLIGLVEHPSRASRDLSSLTTVMTGGALIPAELVRRVKSTFGSLFTITFGQTETSGPAVQTSVHDSERDQAETIGRPLPGMEARIAGLATGEPTVCGTQGEIQLRGPLVMLGYFGQPEASSKAVDSQGWLHTGDLGTMDARGYITITGRSTDMINRGGENIYPREIEDVLFQHASVSDVAVVGVPDARWGEHVAAVIRLQAGVTVPPAAELEAYCETRLARYKIPAVWFFVEEFPQTPSGKIQKFVLRDRIAGQQLTPAL
jgi:fatty-acyl-CoA synthase